MGGFERAFVPGHADGSFLNAYHSRKPFNALQHEALYSGAQCADNFGTNDGDHHHQLCSLMMHPADTKLVCEVAKEAEHALARALSDESFSHTA